MRGIVNTASVYDRKKEGREKGGVERKRENVRRHWTEGTDLHAKKIGTTCSTRSNEGRAG